MLFMRGIIIVIYAVEYTPPLVEVPRITAPSFEHENEDHAILPGGTAAISQLLPESVLIYTSDEP